ncbi:MAG TPA: YkgJ family cysteine cluster protein [Gemmataceae bacterium]
MPQPWYHDGLRFECTRCGHCCTGAPGYVWVTPAELQAIADFLGRPAAEVRAEYARKALGRVSLRERANGDCVFWDRQAGCTVYPARPAQCRTWPFWESNTESRTAWDRAAAGCPGMNHGELISVEEITRRVRVVKV